MFFGTEFHDGTPTGPTGSETLQAVLLDSMMVFGSWLPSCSIQTPALAATDKQLSVRRSQTDPQLETVSNKVQKAA